MHTNPLNQRHDWFLGKTQKKIQALITSNYHKENTMAY